MFCISRKPVSIYKHFIKYCLNDEFYKCNILYNKLLNTRRPLNIHFNNELPFRACCGRNSMKVTKWLYVKSIENNSPIDFTIHNNEIIRRLVTNPKVKVHYLKWVISIASSNNTPFDMKTFGMYLIKYATTHGMYDKAELIKLYKPSQIKPSQIKPSQINVNTNTNNYRDV